MTAGTQQATGTPLLEVRHLVREFHAPKASGGSGGVVHAVSDVSFTIAAGETLGVVGESGCGKSTMARAIMQWPPPTSGAVLLDGLDLTKLSRGELRRARRRLQMVFQDPFLALDPKFSVGESVMEPLVGHRIGEDAADRRRRVDEALDLVGLDPTRYRDRHPRELSGGQCQRVAIARAISISPELILCDEAVSSLDVLVQAQVLTLLDRLRSELGLSYLFISHDLMVVKQVSDRIAVMYLGKLCELGPTVQLFEEPLHPYTAGLLAANPGRESAAPLDIAVLGEPASALDPPSGCRYRTRCPFAQQRCAEEEPTIRELRSGHSVACHFPLQAGAGVSVARMDDHRSAASWGGEPCSTEVSVTAAQGAARRLEKE